MLKRSTKPDNSNNITNILTTAKPQTKQQQQQLQLQQQQQQLGNFCQKANSLNI